ncbi:hypothetical protein JMUB7530_28100 [Staphylococcus aureus]
MSEEKHVVEHEQQKKEKTKKQYKPFWIVMSFIIPVSYTHLRAHETCADLVCRLLLEKIKYFSTL